MKQLHESIVPLVTPFRDGEPDEEGLARLAEWQIANSSYGVSVTGTTGDPSSLSTRERERVVQVDAVAGRAPVLAGMGSNNHDETVQLLRFAQQAGAGAVLLVVPYYVRPAQEGLCRHFRRVAEQHDLPVILYNVPCRTAANLEIDTVAQLRQDCPSIVGIKEANPDFSHISRLLGRVGRNLLVFSGIELLCFPVPAIGGAGYVSATGYVLPAKVAGLYDAWSSGALKEAQDLHYELMSMFGPRMPTVVGALRKPSSPAWSGSALTMSVTCGRRSAGAR